VKYPFLTPEAIESAAERLRASAFGAGRLEPFIDLEVLIYDHLCEQEELVFDDEHCLPPEDGEEVLGKMFPLRGKILIHEPLKRERPLGRYRFTVAHELGHWVLHRPLFLADAQQIPLFGPRIDVQMTSLNRSIFPNGTQEVRLTEEWQANRFASLLLVPPTLLCDEFKRRFGAPPAVYRDGGVPHLPNIRFFARDFATKKVRGKASLHELFGLSAEAMTVTLLQRGLVVDQ
jgi:Zn-dependent peptidase ImmA (M78 family)